MTAMIIISIYLPIVIRYRSITSLTRWLTWFQPKWRMATCQQLSAIRLLCSDDKPIFDSAEVFEKLTERHPLAAGNMQRLEDPALIATLQVSDKEVSKAILSFSAGSSGGPDGLRPRHLIDLINCKTSGQDLLSAITAFTNMLLDGKCHPAVRPILFGGKLTVLAKNSGGIRPIDVGYIRRRIASKCANAFAMNKLGDYLAPTQLGVGVSCGCEAAVHATRRFIETMPADYVVAKLDFSNAFNNIRRDVMLQQVFNQVPEIYKFCCLSYEQPSILRYSSCSISSQEGTQQVDPLECLLLCLVLQPILSSLTSELRIGYIDDITVGGTLTSVEHDVNSIRNNGPSVKLYLNTTKCELITTTTPAQTSILSEFIVVKPSNLCLRSTIISRNLFK